MKNPILALLEKWRKWSKVQRGLGATSPAV